MPADMCIIYIGIFLYKHVACRLMLHAIISIFPCLERLTWRPRMWDQSIGWCCRSTAFLVSLLPVCPLPCPRSGDVAENRASWCAQKHSNSDGVEQWPVRSCLSYFIFYIFYQDDKVGYADMGAAYIGKQQTKILQVLSDLNLNTYSKVSSLDSILALKVGICKITLCHLDIHLYICLRPIK